MARRRDYSAQAKTIAASSTTTFTSSEIPSAGVCAYHLAWTGNTIWSHLSRLRVKANGVAIYDLSAAMLRAFIRRFSKSNYPLPDAMLANGNALGTASASTAGPAGTKLRRATIPFLLLDGESEAERDSTQFPPNSQVTIELQWGSSAAAGNIFCGWTETNVPPMFYPKLYGSQMNIAASVSNGRYNVQDDGNVRAIGLNTVGLERAKLVLAGSQILHSQGISVSGTATGDMLSEMEQLENGYDGIQEGLVTTPSAASINLVSAEVIDPCFFKIDGGPAVPGSSYVELQTGSGWAGTANELTIHSRVPVRR